MGRILPASDAPGLERSCGPSPADTIRAGAPLPGIERIEARFAGHAYDPHRHDTYALGLTLSGVQRFDYRGARTDSTAGRVLAIHPDEVHNGRAGAEGGFAYRMLYLEPRAVRAALGARAGALPFVREPASSDPHLARALRPLLCEFDRTPEELAVTGAVQAIADALLARDPSAGRRPAGICCEAAVERARDLLDAECARTVGSAELEAATGLDRYALARQFRRLHGTSPYRYLTLRRLDRVRARLRAGLGLAEAALECGFADQSHMTRAFKRAFGLAPGAWRALERGDAAGLPSRPRRCTTDAVLNP
ncbi:AraC family transcriptional regulator [Marinivivus vitaminiproducens]|uniref:AraC family transcriptional regulator n=1 Tax=Marinivivus vitaminiproducens TaxID=3035935 RepID=UPI00279AB36B|nr:AraC family transcriptional regulator [Geminicoccaceae bacterium SCSIO 64248]